MKDSRVETRITRVLSKNQNVLRSNSYAGHFEQNQNFVLHTSASPYGISTIFIQSTPNKYDHKILSYSLANLTPTDE